MKSQAPKLIRRFFRGLYLDAKLAVVMIYIGARSKVRRWLGKNDPRW